MSRLTTHQLTAFFLCVACGSQDAIEEEIDTSHNPLSSETEVSTTEDESTETDNNAEEESEAFETEETESPETENETGVETDTGDAQLSCFEQYEEELSICSVVCGGEDTECMKLRCLDVCKDTAIAGLLECEDESLNKDYYACSKECILDHWLCLKIASPLGNCTEDQISSCQDIWTNCESSCVLENGEP